MHGPGPEQESFKTKLVVREEQDAYQEDGTLKDHVISVKDFVDANPEMQGIPETANEQAGPAIHLCYGEDEDVDVATIDVEECIIV